MIVPVKKQEVINALYVAPGVEFQGAAATPQVAGENGQTIRYFRRTYSLKSNI